MVIQDSAYEVLFGIYKYVSNYQCMYASTSGGEVKYIKDIFDW